MHTYSTEPRPDIQTIALPHDYEEPKVEFGLAGVCFKQIDGDFWYGFYLRLAIVINKVTGWVNAIKFCEEYSKHFYHWKRSQQTKDLISAFIKQSTNEIHPAEFLRMKLSSTDDDNSMNLDRRNSYGPRWAAQTMITLGL